MGASRFRRRFGWSVAPLASIVVALIVTFCAVLYLGYEHGLGGLTPAWASVRDCHPVFGSRPVFQQSCPAGRLGHASSALVSPSAIRLTATTSEAIASAAKRQVHQ